MYDSSDFTALKAQVERLGAEGDHTAALAAISAAWPGITPTDGTGLRDLIESVPGALWADDAGIVAALGASYRSLRSPSRSAALPWFDTAQSLIADNPQATDASTRATVNLAHAAALRSIGRPAEARQHVLAATAELAGRSLRPAVRVRIQAGAALELGLLDLHLGEYSTSLTHLRLAYGLSEQSLTLAEFVEGTAGLSFLHYTAGEFDLAIELAAQARLAAGDTGLVTSRFGAPAVIAELLVAIEQNRITEVVSLSPVALASARASDWLPLAHYAVGTASIVTGRFIEGLDELRRSLSAGQGWDARPAILSASEGMRGVLLMHLGETAGATAIFESIRPTHLHANCPGRFLAGVRLGAGDVQGALEALRACDELGELHSSRTLIDVLMIRAAANYELGNPVIADIAFDRALLLASQNGMRTPFLLIANATMQRMLGRAADRNQPDSVHDLLDDLLAGTGTPVRGALEPLSARERDIAYHLHLDKTVNQIAAELYISTNTVKTHVRSIYRKLGATNRKDAMRRVRELGLHLEITPF